MTDVDRPRLGENRPNDFADSGGSLFNLCIGNNCPDFEGVKTGVKPAWLSEKRPNEGVSNSDEYGGKLTDTPAEHSLTWTLQKKRAQELSTLLRTMKGWKYGGEVDRCATQLWLNHYKDSNRYKVRPFSTCKKRICPLCGWVRNQQLWGYASYNLPNLVKGQGRLRYRLLTLTVKNCSFEELRPTVKKMTKALRQLVKSKEWDAVGWVRSLEITYNEKNGTYHPHIHILMASPWNNPMTETKQWVKIWRRCMRLNYDPVCDIRAVRRRHGMEAALSGLSETMKYLFKPSDIEKNPHAMAAAFEEVKGLRLLGSGGIFVSIFEKPAHEKDTEKPVAVGAYGWRANECQYRKKIGGF
jgi:plasmid rolling circle replication initiator protein Rep